MVDDEDVVGQEEHEVAVTLVARHGEPNRIELERELVAERTVEPEMGVVRAAEQIDERAHHREQRRLLAAQLFREPFVGDPNRSGDGVRIRVQGLDRVAVPDRRRDGGNEHRAALVAGPDLEAALPAGEREGRVAEPHVPAGVAPGILERRGEQHPEPLVERAGETRNGVFSGFDPVGARDRDAPGARVRR